MDVKIKLLSPTIISNGEGWASIVDLDIVFDDVGLPFIPARRIKGVLRESAFEVINMTNFSGINKFSESDINDLFGKNWLNAKIIIDNFMMNSYEEYRKWVIWLNLKHPEIFNSASIQKSFTVIRTSTTVDERGISEEGSLRTVRMLRRGLEFEGTISTVDIENDEKLYSLLILSMLNVRRIGTGRNRGFGNIKFIIKDESKEKALNFIKGE